jgi:light-regulated signal transduction histidine kinase (bacteriophytochrome)
VSHNLRAPIAKILGLASLFEKDSPSSSLNQEIIGLVYNEVSELDQIVKDLNTILAHQSSDGKIMETVSLDDLISESKKHLQNEISQSQASIDCSFNEVKTVKTVKSYLFNICNNLISNAVKFKHPDRPPQITITSHIDGAFICITIRGR